MNEKEKQVTEGLPPEEEIVKLLGEYAGRMWKKITRYMRENYSYEPVREKENLDSTIRYRKSGKTLLTFYPKKNELVVLIIFGKKEVEKFENSKAEFSPEIVELFDNTKQYHDGKWIHIKIPPFQKIDDIERLLAIKKPPNTGK